MPPVVNRQYPRLNPNLRDTISVTSISRFPLFSNASMLKRSAGPEIPSAATTWPDLDLLDTHIPVAADLAARALAAEDAARAVLAAISERWELVERGKS